MGVGLVSGGKQDDDEHMEPCVFGCAAMQTQEQIIKEKLAQNYVYFLFVFSYVFYAHTVSTSICARPTCLSAQANR